MPVNFRSLIYYITNWEAWDWRLKYVPLVPYWISYCIRSGSLWFFTPSNPSLVFGGFDGVSKREMYQQLPPGSYPKTIYISGKSSFSEVISLFTLNHFHYPVAVKPETGRMGLMFRKIETISELRLYHEKMPVDYILQDFIDYPIEVSVFYYRFPGEDTGTITGFLMKDYLQVRGDGRSTLCELITASPRAYLRIKELKLKHKDKLDDIIPEGKMFRLSDALNLSRGGKLVCLEHEKDERLLETINKLSCYSRHFYYGRYDIKCASVEDLKRGENFTILEYNGSGGEPHHVYGNGNSLFTACKILLQHWDVLYKISKHNHKKGISYWKLAEGWKFLKEANKHVSLLRKLDLEFPVS